MDTIVSSIIGIIIFSFIIFLLNGIMPEGGLKKTINFIYGLLITLLIVQPIIYTLNNFTVPAINNSYYFNVNQYSEGIKIQIRQYDGFENAIVNIEGNNNKIDKIYIKTFKTENDNMINYEKNKKIIINILTELYNVNESSIIIEVA